MTSELLRPTKLQTPARVLAAAPQKKRAWWKCGVALSCCTSFETPLLAISASKCSSQRHQPTNQTTNQTKNQVSRARERDRHRNMCAGRNIVRTGAWRLGCQSQRQRGVLPAHAGPSTILPVTQQNIPTASFDAHELTPTGAQAPAPSCAAKQTTHVRPRTKKIFPLRLRQVRPVNNNAAPVLQLLVGEL